MNPPSHRCLKANSCIEMQVTLEVGKVLLFKCESIKSSSSASGAVIQFDGRQNFLPRPRLLFRFHLNLGDVCVGVLFSQFVCEFICILCVCVSVCAISLRRPMINLCLTCLFTELVGRPWGPRAACNAANNSSNEKMQMIRLDPAPNP